MAKKSKKKLLSKIKDKLKKEIRKKDEFSILEISILIIVSILLGIIIGNCISFTKNKSVTRKIPIELEELVNTYDSILDNYDGKIKKSELVDFGIRGLVSYLDDPYSVFMDQDTTDDFNQTVDGEYSGIGATVSYSDGKAIIAGFFNKSPAKKAGLKIGDQIIEIEGKNVEGKTLNEISELMKDKKNKVLKIKVRREDNELLVSIKKDKIEISSVSSKIIEKNNKIVGYIKIDTFAANTSKQFKKQLQSLENKKISSLVIDVRDNLGGHLQQVSNIMQQFMEKGKIIYQIKNKNKVIKYKDTTKEKRDYKVIVLTNGASASASEVLAAAFKESYKNSLLLGTKTYGKGTVQKSYSLSSGASIKYTIEKWLTPNGKWINEKGVKPNLEVKLDKAFKDNPSDETDNQLQSALEEIIKE